MSGKDGLKFAPTNLGDHPPSIELYLARRYFTVTQDMVSEDNPLRVVSAEDLQWLLQTAGPALSGEKVREPVKKPEPAKDSDFLTGLGLQSRQ
jgi:putative DNA primase/helicase